MKNKKMIAAASAVLACINEEEDVVCAVAMQASTQARKLRASGQPPASPWGTSGRQAQMQLRSMMQLKAFHGFRP